MRTNYVVVCALLVLASAIAPTALAQTEDVTLTVTVVNEDGDPVGGAELTVSWDGGEATETTRSNGQALIDVPEGSDVTITVADDRYVRNAPFVVTDAQGGEVTVEVARQGSAVVRVAEGSQGLANAHVVVSRDGEAVVSGSTNENGGFQTGTIEQGSYDLRIVKPGYYAVERSLSVTGDVFRTVSLEQGSVSVTFRVVDDHFAENRTLAGSTVRVGSLATLNTSQDGAATIGIPVNSVFEVRVSNDGYRTGTERLVVNESGTTVTYGIRRTPSLTVSPANTQVVVNQTVRVEVTDEYDEAVADATLTLDGESVATTGADGVARVRIPSAGDHELAATTGNVTAESVTVEGVSAGQATRTATDTPEPTTSEPTDTPAPTTTTSSGDGPGFGVLAAALALALSALLLGRRR
ncbi:carboxypeptidase regulatory-like domain-containing protein [Halomarina litorea]|uniref:carboxypeptidase regulatory-like domain-containing protein n=1 Tax=Halomarina litorea TaxID=2961595 RepID=UPI0020C20347|nr:carboxypeptidase regulatory-like domain-containing protein [Halomarina sp. BCD28]